ncbi:alpha-L-rhamnosidase [Arthrobacter sp. MDT1-48-3]
MTLPVPPSGAMIKARVPMECAPLFRRAFTLPTGHGALRSATLLITSLGICEAWINGKPASPDVLTPGWSSYEWRLRYAQWDVTDLVEQDSVLGIAVGNGWSRGRLGFSGSQAIYGDTRGILAELRLTFADGFTHSISTDESWESGPSAILTDDLYDGQTIDGTQAAAARGNLMPGDASIWAGVDVVEDFDRNRLVPYISPPVRRQEQLRPTRIWTSPAGATLVDFGQNLVGWIRVDVQGEPGAILELRHAEVLEHDELGMRPLRSAKATDRYILSGEADTFEPTFTFHGFRYAEITGWPGSADELQESLTAVVVGSDLARTGYFECSNPLLNQLHSNIVWSMKGNFVDVPTDCPQRDERLGWTGDLAAFAPTGLYLYDAKDFLRDWLQDLAAEQTAAGGAIPMVVPDNFKYDKLAAENAEATGMPDITVLALWNDAAIWVPWAVWEATGDSQVLSDQFASMSSYARRIGTTISERGLLDGGLQLGDWLDPTAPPENPMAGASDRFVVATACVYRSAALMARTAEVLGKTLEQEEFETLARKIKDGFTREYVAGARIRSDAPAVYALAIAFDLLDDEVRTAAGERLAELVQESEFHISTGFAGTPFIAGALSETGHLDVAYKLLLQQGCPSWLYPVTLGATTIWERWDSMLPDGSINPGEMTSFNHYAFGAIGDWMHKVVGGIAPLEPGYRTVLIEPQPGGDLTWAKVSLMTQQGLVSIHWELNDDGLSVNVKIPAGSTGIVRLPGIPETQIGAGHHHLTALTA